MRSGLSSSGKWSQFAIAGDAGAELVCLYSVLGNIYARAFKGTAFTAMVTGMFFFS